MKSAVIYRSKSGNTRGVAELMAKKLGTKALPVNLLEKKGRGSKEEQDKEKLLFEEALSASKDADLVILGTPVSFEQAHGQIARFAKQVEAKNVGIFCTYIKKMGTTLEDLKASLTGRGIKVVGVVDFGNLNSGKFSVLDESQKNEYIKKMEGFVRDCITNL